MITFARLMMLLTTILIAWLVVAAALWYLADADAALHWKTAYWKIQAPWFLAINLGNSNFWSNVTDLGDAAVLLPFVILPCIRSKPQVCAALIAALPFGVLVAIAKKLLAVPRPALVLGNDSFSITGTALAGHTSLPSGHSVTVFTTIGILCFSLTRQRTLHYGVLWFIGLSGALTVGLSRVIVGAHWPLDVFFGATLGLFFAASAVLLTTTYSGWWRWLLRAQHTIWISIGLGVWCVALIIRALNTAPSLSISLWFSALVCVITALYLVRSRCLVSDSQIS